MNRTFTVKHTTDRRGRPLAVIDGLPGGAAEFSAEDLRKNARTFEDIADACDRGVGAGYPETATYNTHQVRNNPFVTYRAEICGGYSTGQRLAALTLHLYNGAAHGVRLDNLLSSADERHTRIALELLAWYAKHGENCIDFMDLARDLREREAA